MISNVKEKSTLTGILKSLGPGILFAGAAIGGSHLVQSTRAGANYGLELLWAVLLINLFKYPFFEYGRRYTAATGKSILVGYRELGKWAVSVFFGLSMITAVVNFTAVTIVSAGLLDHFFRLSVPPVYAVMLILIAVITMLRIGKYAALDKTVKAMIFILSITTIIAFFMAIAQPAAPKAEAASPDLWNAAGIAFLIALMGWMPAPIEGSVWPSLWALERQNETKYNPKFREALFDFNLGYIGTALMAIFFVGLGAYVMHGTGQQFSGSGVVFSGQLVDLYTKTLGDWSYWIISAIVLITMFSTSLTVVDAYPRTLEGSMIQIWPNIAKYFGRIYWVWIILLSLCTVFIIGFYTSSLKVLIDIATIVSFLAAPVFAIINYKVVISETFPKPARPKLPMRVISIAGIIFLLAFSLLFIYSLFWLV